MPNPYAVHHANCQLIKGGECNCEASIGERLPLNLYKAVMLAKFLIEEKGKMAKIGYIIAARKHNIAHWSVVRKAYQPFKKTNR